jgi:hypothetical protein
MGFVSLSHVLKKSQYHKHEANFATKSRSHMNCGLKTGKGQMVRRMNDCFRSINALQKHPDREFLKRQDKWLL